MPSSVTQVVMSHDHGRILDDFTAKEAVGIIEVHFEQFARVEQPVVMVGQPLNLRLVTSEVTNILARTVGELRAPHKRL